MENYVGKRLDGRYEIQEIIGVGGMSVVYKAYDNVDDRIVAVKVLKEEFADDADFVRRFKNESKAIAVLSHPNIVKVYDVSFGEKIKYIVMEYVDGITLKEYIQKQKVITWNDAVFFTIQILKALQHAHDKGIIHRDIKPQNIILLPTGNIKVTDFGIARFSRTETRTLTENAIGSVHYISPEQAKGELTDQRADIYSLGVVLYEMLSGKVPFEADSAVSVALMQLQQDPIKLTEINSDIPLGLEQICFHAMQKNPQSRYQSATEMLIDLEEISKNPTKTFNYTYFVDKEPTKYVYKEQDNLENNTVDEDITSDDKASENEKKKQKNKIIVAIVICSVLLIGAIVGVVLYMTQGVNTDSISVDNFVGMVYDNVISNEKYADIQFIPEYKDIENQKSGTIVSQMPEAGEKIIKGSTVNVVVAKTFEDIAIPNCYGADAERAKSVLEKNNLKKYKIKMVSDESVEENHVIYTDPKAGSVVSTDQEIIIYVSSGPSTTTVNSFSIPDVIGLSQSDAKSFMLKTGFKNITIETIDDEAPKGVVIAQTPSSGSKVKEDENIKLTVSTGITTTQAADQYTVYVKVKLPSFKDNNGKYPSDNLIVYLNNSQYDSKEVVLNGTNVDLAIPVDNGLEVQLTIVLSDSGESQNFKLTINQDKSLNVDFSQRSDNN